MTIHSLRPAGQELLWLTSLFIGSLLLCAVCFSWNLAEGTLSTQLFQVRLAVNTKTGLFLMFLLVSFIVYFVREKKHAFTRQAPNRILFGSGLLLVFMASFINSLVKRYAFTGGFSDDREAALQWRLAEMAKTASSFFIALQAATVLMLLYVVWQSGREKVRRQAYAED